ncbi:hypothetical protein [Nicoliella lavandulae]|uniref:Uncharacterized protein n=1 Tax=Nicoliella lavandulae TaxID=3082954 RepID=A0ABU8SJ39_9LACO
MINISKRKDIVNINNKLVKKKPENINDKTTDDISKESPKQRKITLILLVIIVIVAVVAALIVHFFNIQ